MTQSACEVHRNGTWETTGGEKIISSCTREIMLHCGRLSEFRTLKYFISQAEKEKQTNKENKNELELTLDTPSIAS